jgi:VCBS repeat-containing protein
MLGISIGPAGGVVTRAAKDAFSYTVQNNKVLRLGPGTLPVVYGVQGNASAIGRVVQTASGASATVAANGEFHYSTAGVFDHLDPGQTATDTFTVATSPASNGASVWSAANTQLSAGWTDNGNQTYTHAASGGTASVNFRQLAITTGTSYYINLTVTGRTTGNLAVQWSNNSLGFIGGISPAVITANGTYSYSNTAPAGATAVRFSPTTDFNGTISAIAIIPIVLGSAKTVRVKVTASDRVGAKLTTNSSFSGSNWTADGTGGWTHAAGAADNLNATVALTADKVYQIAATVSGRSAGSVTPAIVGSTTATAEYTLSTNDREVWLIRAPAAPTTIRFVPSTDFNGKISSIHVRELITSGAVPTPELVATGNVGAVNLKWYLPPASGRYSTGKTPSISITGTLNYNAEFGYRNLSANAFVGGFLADNTSSVGKRVSISSNPGGDWGEIWKVTATGGYSNAATAGSFQCGVTLGENATPLRRLYAYHYVSDLLLNPNNNDYGAHNSDNLLLNSNVQKQYFETYAYMINLDLRNPSDATIDNKQLAYLSHSTLVGGNRIIRTHETAHWHLDGVEFTRSANTQTNIWFHNGRTRAQLWNCYVEGQRLRSAAHAISIVPGVGTFPTIGGMYADDATNTEIGYLATVLKTYPSMPDASRVNMTDMEFEYKLSASGSWSSLSVPRVGLPGVVGSFIRTVAVSAGTYDFRSRCRNGADTGSWGYANNITIT